MDTHSPTQSGTLTKRAFIYLRVSSDGQGQTDYDPDGLSIAAQREAATDKAIQLDASIADEWTDPGRSAYVDLHKRTGFLAMLEELKRCNQYEATRVDYVIVWSLSRWARNTVDHWQTRELVRKTGARLISITEPMAGEDTASGFLYEGKPWRPTQNPMLLPPFGLELERAAQRLIAGLHAAALQGAPGTKPAPGQCPQSPGRFWRRRISTDRLQRPPPTGFVKKVDDDVRQKSETFVDGRMQILVRRRFERPVDKHGSPDHIFLRDESPVAAVQTHVPVVAHAEVAVRRNHEIAILNVLWQGQAPPGDDTTVLRRRHRGELVTIGVVGKVRVSILRHQVRFGELLAVDHAEGRG